MIPAAAVDLVALACLAAGLLRDLASEFGLGPATAHPGLGWYRAGVLGLWLALALRLEAGAAPWLAAAGALAATLPLHLLHVQGWKGARGRRATLVGAALALAGALLAWCAGRR